MSSTDLFDAITALPAAEKADLDSRLGRETDLLEEWRDIAVLMRGRMKIRFPGTSISAVLA